MECKSSTLFTIRAGVLISHGFCPAVWSKVKRIQLKRYRLTTYPLKWPGATTTAASEISTKCWHDSSSSTSSWNDPNMATTDYRVPRATSTTFHKLIHNIFSLYEKHIVVVVAHKNISHLFWNNSNYGNGLKRVRRVLHNFFGRTRIGWWRRRRRTEGPFDNLAIKKPKLLQCRRAR